MPPTTPPLQFDHQKGYEIETKHKEAIRRLHWRAKIPVRELADEYHLGQSEVYRILAYPAPGRARPGRKGPPQKLTDAQVNEIIEYCSESWEHRVLNYQILCAELDLACTPSTLQHRLHQRGYFRYTACQKPYLTASQVIARLLWAIAHIFWHEEWLKVLWSDEVTFLVGGRTCKEKVTRKRGERFYPTCIQY
jgi:transposase